MMNKNNFFNKHNIINYQQKKKFKSKKNNVFLFTGWDDKGRLYQWIRKEYNKKSHMEKEFRILQKLKKNGVRVPRVYFKNIKEDVLILEYIEGTLLLEYIEECEKENVKAKELNIVLTALLDWFVNFYNTFSGNQNYIMEDINFRNFILRNNSIWGLDFEDCIYGKQERDIGRIFAFIVSYHPPFSKWKINMLKEFLHISKNYFQLDMQGVKKALIEELTAIERRRAMVISDNIKIHLLRIVS